MYKLTEKWFKKSKNLLCLDQKGSKGTKEEPKRDLKVTQNGPKKAKKGPKTDLKETKNVLYKMTEKMTKKSGYYISIKRAIFLHADFMKLLTNFKASYVIETKKLNQNCQGGLLQSLFF